MLTAVLRILWAGGLNAWIAGMFFITWFYPYAFGPLTVHHLTFVMLMEFLVVHSSGFMGAIAARDATRRSRLLLFSGLTALYTMFAASFAAMYGGWWPMWAFWGLIMSRFPTVVLRPPDFQGQSVIIANWAAMVVLYLGGTAVTAIADIPQFGVTKEVIESQHFSGGGLWPEEPYRVMAFGGLYFSGLTLLAVINEGYSIVHARKREASEKGRPAEAEI